MTDHFQGPDASVALLTRNGGSLLERLLRAVRAQSTERRIEIVAVDSGSTDGTLEVLARFGARVAHVEAHEFNFGLTRDKVFGMARGEYIVSLSQDAIPADAHWLDNLIAPLSDRAVGASCGRSIPDPHREFPQFYWEASGHFYFTREMRKFARRYGRGLSNANAAYRRETWERLGFGDQPIGEDFKFQTKLHAEGLRIQFPDAPVLHHHNYTCKQLWRRCRNEGYGLRLLGCPYSELDLLLDLVNPRINRAWVGSLPRLQNAEVLFPTVRPLAVYAGSRFARGFAR